MNKQTFKRAIAGAVLAVLAGAAGATDFWVDAKLNSVAGGEGNTGVGNGFGLTTGEYFSINVDPNESLWNFSGGDPTYTVNANGSSNPLGIYNPDGTTYISTTFGKLIGQIGNGQYFNVGMNFSGVASSTGQLKLWFADTDSYNNIGTVLAHVSAVPEPSAFLLMGLGLAAVGLQRRRDNKA